MHQKRGTLTVARSTSWGLRTYPIHRNEQRRPHAVCRYTAPNIPKRYNTD